MRKFLQVWWPALLIAAILLGATASLIVGTHTPGRPVPVSNPANGTIPTKVDPAPVLPAVAETPVLPVPEAAPSAPAPKAPTTTKAKPKAVTPKSKKTIPVQPGGDWGETPCYLQTHDRTAECLYRDKVQNEQDAAASKPAPKVAPTTKKFTPPKTLPTANPCMLPKYYDYTTGKCETEHEIKPAAKKQPADYKPDTDVDYTGPICKPNYSAQSDGSCKYHKPTGTDEDN